MMKNANYYQEFYEGLDKRLECFILNWGADNKVMLGKHHIEKPFKTFLLYRLSLEKDYYNECRLKGMSINKAMEKVDTFLNIINNASNEEESWDEKLTDIKEHPWHELLSEYSGAWIIYLFNATQLQYLMSLPLQLNSQVMLLTEYDIPEETQLPEYVTALSIEFSNKYSLTDSKLKRHFPLLFHYANTLDILFQIIQPCGVICIEGCHFQEQLLAAIAESYDIPKKYL